MILFSKVLKITEKLYWYYKNHVSSSIMPTIYIIHMKEITLHNQWIIKAPLDDIFKIVTDFEKLPEYFPKVAESIQINKREGNYLEMDAIVGSFG